MTDNRLISYDDASLSYGTHLLWKDLSLGISPGEFVVVLGPNGAGKTSLIKSLLKITPLTSGTLNISPHLCIGYVPQLNSFDPKIPLRGRDLIRLGLDGNERFLGLFSKKTRKEKNYLIEQALAEVDAQHYGDAPISLLSGGERQRLRIAQALVSQPQLLVLDEPLASLDITSQKIICNILDHQKNEHHTAILIVTHEINPLLNLVDNAVYIANGKALVGKPGDVLTSERLSQLFQNPVRVIRENNRIFILIDNHQNTYIKHLSPEK